MKKFWKCALVVAVQHWECTELNHTLRTMSTVVKLWQIHIGTCCALYLEYSFICMAQSLVLLMSLLKCCFPRDPLSKEISCLYLLPFCHSPWPCSALFFSTALGIFRNDFAYLFPYLLLISSTKIQTATGQGLHSSWSLKDFQPFKIVSHKEGVFSNYFFGK